MPSHLVERAVLVGSGIVLGLVLERLWVRRRASSSDAPCLAACLTVADMRECARAALPAADLDYFEGGAEEEVTLRGNVEAFERRIMWPRVLRDVKHVDLTVSVLGMRLSSPIGVAPVAMQKIADAGGEAAAARACARQGSVYCASQQATTQIEQTAAAADAAAPGAPRWFQLYVERDRAATIALARRAKECGCSALVVTVDAPVLGRRLRDQRNRWQLREGLSLAHRPAESSATQNGGGGDPQKALARRIGGRDAGLDWDAVGALGAATGLPIILKGVVTSEDARKATQVSGIAGLWVSNHGGRQLDGGPSTLEALPEVVAGVGGQLPIFFDGGIRRGVDALKALALGASLVFVGRPVIYGLAAGGEEGVHRMLEVLQEELRCAMALSGLSSVAEATPSMVTLRK
jgi:isopentenyl diphosphate isomerase/L-lactate dehydrogenase-like FMN-dependent dehydrogenase